MDTTAQPNRPKIAETVIHSTASIRDSSIGKCCEILADTSLHTVELGDYFYLGPRCIVGDATIGQFCAIAAEVRIGAPNHPMDRPSMHRFSYCQSIALGTLCATNPSLISERKIALLKRIQVAGSKRPG
jgi:carbonic anhydrase/acetyltransferase-like protein (isoleucine patch superfamily)